MGIGFTHMELSIAPVQHRAPERSQKFVVPKAGEIAAHYYQPREVDGPPVSG